MEKYNFHISEFFLVLSEVLSSFHHIELNRARDPCDSDVLTCSLCIFEIKRPFNHHL